MPMSYDQLLKTRLQFLGYDAWELGGGGDCFFNSISPSVGMSPPELRRGVAQHMRDNEEIYGALGDFDRYGGYQSYCDLVGTCGFYVQGNAEIAATSDFIARHLLILGADADHDVYVFAGAIGLGAPAHLGMDEAPIIIAHWRTSQHYTSTRLIIMRPWCAPKGAKRARIQELQKEYDNDLHRAASTTVDPTTEALSNSQDERTPAALL